MPKTCGDTKVYCRTLTWLEKLRICLQILNELHNDVLRYRYFHSIDSSILLQNYSGKNNIQIVCVQLIQLTYPFN